MCNSTGQDWPKLPSKVVSINYANFQISEMPKKSNMPVFLVEVIIVGDTICHQNIWIKRNVYKYPNQN